LLNVISANQVSFKMYQPFAIATSSPGSHERVETSEKPPSKKRPIKRKPDQKKPVQEGSGAKYVKEHRLRRSL